MADKNHPEHAFFSLEKAQEICRIFAQEYGLNSIDIQGGEPTIYPHIFELITYCNSINLKPTLITNLISLANFKHCLKFKEAGVYDFLVSLHGIGENYDKVVGKKGAFEKQIQALENLKQLEIPIRVNAVLSNEIINDLEQIINLAITYKARAVNFLAYNNTGDQKILRDTHKIPYYDIIGEKLEQCVEILESQNIEVNIRFLPFCVIGEKYRKNIQNSLQMIYDNHEWEISSRLWIDRPAQRRAKESIEKRKSVYYLSRIKFSKFYREKSLQEKLWWLRSLIKPFFGFFIPKNYKKYLPYQKPILKKIRFYTPDIDEAYINGGGGISKMEAFYIEQSKIMAKVSSHKIYHKKCLDCSISHICDGFYRDFIDEFGSNAIKPIEILTPQGNKCQIYDPTYYTQHQYKVIEQQEFEWFFDEEEKKEIKRQMETLNVK
nr:radical SAM protein [Helicobacter japonicus]